MKKFIFSNVDLTSLEMNFFIGIFQEFWMQIPPANFQTSYF